MITTLLQGGLGNQIFQICAAMSLAMENDDEFVFDMSTHLLPNQGRRCNNYAKNIFRNINFSINLPIQHVYHEPRFAYDKIPYKNNTCLVGYFQSEKYFRKYSDEAKSTLAPDPASLEYIKNKYGEILKKNTVAVHVRRGDYMKSPKYHPTATLGYYNKAMERFQRDSVFLIFSDDIEWCKTVFKGNAFVFVENNEDYLDLYLISLCKHAIIANSSFGWWGAWLNNNKNKMIIAPQTWFGSSAQHNTKDLYCDGWTVI